jgi:hypothetical protein
MILALYNPEWPAEFGALIAVYMSSPDKLVLRYEKRKLDIVERSGGDRKVYAQIKEIECRDFVESVLTANLKAHPAQDTCHE